MHFNASFISSTSLWTADGAADPALHFGTFILTPAAIQRRKITYFMSFPVVHPIKTHILKKYEKGTQPKRCFLNRKSPTSSCRRFRSARREKKKSWFSSILVFDFILVTAKSPYPKQEVSTKIKPKIHFRSPLCSGRHQTRSIWFFKRVNNTQTSRKWRRHFMLQTNMASHYCWEAYFKLAYVKL